MLVEADPARIPRVERTPVMRFVPAVLLATVVLATVVLAVVATVMPAAPAAALSLRAKPTFTPQERAAAIVAPAVLYVEVGWQGRLRSRVTAALWDEQSVSVTIGCTGFAVSSDGFIVTAGRCVDPGMAGVGRSFAEEIARRRVDTGTATPSQGQALIQEMLSDAAVEGAIAGSPVLRDVFVQRGAASPGLTSAQASPALVVSFRPFSTGDVALLKVEKSNQPMVKLADSSDTKVDEEVLAIGYPGQVGPPTQAMLEPSTRTGKISSVPTTAADSVPLFETSVPTTLGMSGGPVANLAGEIIGLVSHEPAGQVRGVVTASSLIAQELAAGKAENNLGKIDNDYRDGLDAYYDGRYTDSIQKLDAVLAAMPSHEQAQEFRRKAMGLRQSEGPGQAPGINIPGVPDAPGMPGGIGGVLVLVAVVVILVAFVARVRRRPQRPAIVAASPAIVAASPATAGASPATAGASPATTGAAPGTHAVAVPFATPALRYCTNCGTAAPPSVPQRTQSCEICGQRYP